MHRIRVRHGIVRLLSLAAIIVALIVGSIVSGFASPRATGAASGTTIAAPSPTATDTATSVKGGASGSAPWGFVLASGAALAIFVVGGLIIVLRSRREYLDEQARKAAKARDDD